LLDDGEVDFYLIEPGRVDRGVHHDRVGELLSESVDGFLSPVGPSRCRPPRTVPGVVVVLALAVPPSSVSDNGLGFTATAELAGRAWSGRGLGVQNTMPPRVMLGRVHVPRSRARRPTMEAYAGKQLVGIDLHRRRNPEIASSRTLDRIATSTTLAREQNC
jgi:hypothetical protein